MTVHPAFPVTAAQRSIYLGHQFDPQGILYNTGIHTDSQGAIDIDRLVRTAEAIVRQAEPLHVNFRVDDDGELTQVPRGRAAWRMPVIDFRGEADPDSASRAWMAERMARALDLERDELVTFALHRLADDQIRVHQQYHHIVNDGFGIAVVVAQITKAYARDAVPDLSDEWSLARYVAADQDYRSSAEFERDRAYWLDELGDLPPTPRLIAAAHSHGVEIHVWTVNDVERMRELIAMGVDGIVTDRADLAIAALRPQ